MITDNDPTIALAPEVTSADLEERWEAIATQTDSATLVTALGHDPSLSAIRERAQVPHVSLLLDVSVWVRNQGILQVDATDLGIDRTGALPCFSPPSSPPQNRQHTWSPWDQCTKPPARTVRTSSGRVPFAAATSSSSPPVRSTPARRSAGHT